MMRRQRLGVGWGSADRLISIFNAAAELPSVMQVHEEGSEYPVVVIPLTTEHNTMLGCNLLYVGVTSGKHLLEIAVRAVTAHTPMAKNKIG